ncbi:uncharacterized protein N7483_003341, partial [Penicillium malachiteum]|uniref:uncharacterized protein n=1 Tax=Penicillium malachiteum TaxID=1324776 RepID=UPI002549B17E
EPIIMKRQYLPSDTLPAWLLLNGITTNGVAVQNLDSELGTDKGNAVVATADKQDQRESDVLLHVPRDLVLSLEEVKNYAKSDQDLREVLEAAGQFGRTMRGAIMTFLLVQITHNSLQGSRKIGVSNPWTEYIKFLSPSFSLPTFWTEEERELLRGTSLQAAVEAKLNVMEKEFEFFRQATEKIVWCQQYWWNESSDGLAFDDWKYVDAAYRSRMLDLPGSGHSMVPCIDMVNHVAGPAVKALYDTDSEGNAVLRLREFKTIKRGEEVTISYGDTKAASEMIFSYGFLDSEIGGTTQVTLDIEFPEDDPLGMAKKIICQDTLGIRILAFHDPAQPNTLSWTGFGDVNWDSPLIWWSSVNEEDGLEIGVAQTTDGNKQLEAKWKDVKVESAHQLIELIAAEPLVEVFQLRAVVLVLGRLETQLATIRETDEVLKSVQADPALLAGICRPEIYDMISRLRGLEAALLQQAVEELMQQQTELMKSETVAAYLNAQSQAEEVEDFS